MAADRKQRLDNLPGWSWDVAANAFDRLNAEEKRWLKPRKLADHEKTLKIDSKDWHKIREIELSDDLAII
jgi:hypothetical protein